MDRDTVQLVTGEAAQELAKLTRASHRVDGADCRAGERLEHAPVARTHGETSSGEVRGDCLENPLGQGYLPPFQVENELSVGRRRLE